MILIVLNIYKLIVLALGIHNYYKLLKFFYFN